MHPTNFNCIVMENKDFTLGGIFGIVQQCSFRKTNALSALRGNIEEVLQEPYSTKNFTPTGRKRTVPY